MLVVRPAATSHPRPSQVYLQDVSGAGQVTFPELLRAMHAAELRSDRHGTYTPTGFATAAAAGPGAVRSRGAAVGPYESPDSWRLEPYQ